MSTDEDPAIHSEVDEAQAEPLQPALMTGRTTEPPPPTPMAVDAALPSDAGEPKKKRWIIPAALVGVVVVAGVAFAATRSGGPSKIDEAAESCGTELNVGDDGSSISFDTEGEEESFGDSYQDVACVLLALEVPDRVTNQIDQTRALDGRQSAEWDGLEASWGYHPDNGLNITIFEG